MLTKTAIAAAFVAAVAAQPATVANAGDIGFSFGVQTGNGYVAFGNTGPGYYEPDYGPGWGPGGSGPDSYSCNEARHELQWEFKHVQKIECNGGTYTFKVKKKNIGPWKIVKFNRHTGNYWYA